MKKGSAKKGFTLIELTLSIIFISILSLTIMLIINNTIASYRRGITLNKVNTVGMDLVDDMRAAVQNAPVRSLIAECEDFGGDKADCEKDKGYNFMSVVRLARVSIRRDQKDDVPVFGAFCTGSYSYIWNSGYYFAGSDATVDGGGFGARLTYKNTAGATVTVSEFRLLKVKDDTRQVCIGAVEKANGNNGYKLKRIGNSDGNDIDNDFNLGDEAINEEPMEILVGGGENNLAIYNISTSIPAENDVANNMFYAVSFILGTVQGGVNIQSTGNFCVPPEDYGSGVENFDYCAINKFNFAAQAIGG